MVVNAAREQYEAGMDVVCGDNAPSVSAVDLKAIHTRELNAAKATFNSIKKMGSKEDVELYLGKLIEVAYNRCLYWQHVGNLPRPLSSFVLTEACAFISIGTYQIMVNLPITFKERDSRNKILCFDFLSLLQDHKASAFPSSLLLTILIYSQKKSAQKLSQKSVVNCPLQSAS